MSLDNTLTATAHSRLPNPAAASPISFIGWMAVTHLRTTSRSGTPGENVGRSIEFSSTCWGELAFQTKLEFTNSSVTPCCGFTLPDIITSLSWARTRKTAHRTSRSLPNRPYGLRERTR
jgi:hypothetical protein